jgi:hypothetical protein
MRRLLIAAYLAILVSGACTSSAADESEPVWSENPAAPGAGLPPAGRSLFDYEFSAIRDGQHVYDLPFPFSALLERLNERSGGNVRAVLIPLGRSLQRSAAKPDYFESPRVVVAVVGDAAPAAAASNATLKDRFFLGYQERADILEVISYNETAGRFEFQVVHGYRAGAEPQVQYAERSACVTCHQNHAPLFSRPLWDETNANADVAARLAIVQTSFHGVAARVGVDIPDAIDAATDRANRLSAYQRIWADGCGLSNSLEAVACRGALLVAALRYGLAGQRHSRAADFERDSIRQVLRQQWPLVWPGGLAISNPDIPNRKLVLFEPGRGPLELAGALQRGTALSKQDTANAATVPLHLEPLNPRAPLAIWRAVDVDDARLDEIVAGLASFLSPRDIADLHGLLTSRQSAPPAQTLVSACELSQVGGAGSAEEAVGLRVACEDSASGLRLDASLSLSAAPDAAATLGSGTLHRLVLPDGDRLRGRTLSVTAQTTAAKRLRLHIETGPGGLRDASANAIAEVTLTLGEHEGSATLQVEFVPDFHLLAQAVTALQAQTLAGGSFALAAMPFQKFSVLTELFDLLGGTYEPGCCDPLSQMPPAVVQGVLPGAGD